MAAQRQHAIALRIGHDLADVDALELGFGGGKLVVLAGGIRAHESAGADCRIIACARDGFEAPLDRIDVFVARAVRVDHAANFQHLDFVGDGTRRGRRCAVEHLCSALGIGPLQHLELTGESRLRGAHGCSRGAEHKRPDYRVNVNFSHIRPVLDRGATP